MNLRIPAFFLALGAALSVPSAFAADAAIAWQGKGADGKTIRFDPQHLRRPAILLFWATWCPYCEALMPYVQRVLDAAGKDRLDVYAIDIKEDGDPVKTLRERKLGFTLIVDGDAIADQYAVRGTPGLFLVDTHGKVVYRRSGGDAPEKVEAALREKLHLAVPAR
ncbi:TlpA disulfide reductase family protein [Rudaea sp.]|uniref:TlpA family protein disulfide reductase n=1 Tax=Rudaea sp. TaxID=2136325 RepID=UPI00321FD516